ncbi:hypothetical protein [Pseudonocardia endophytica]|uniref:Uncharacterized protein n=1 Tax=Pseudonocardia endophytica TaxID=401976 RepID=A0A4R1I016_PSEEN|nr:hypothetical protein [Pseudonocardia endophytica]TCK27183.1 hypothetical protein EV378_3049 [Pseudonocardia endophytica]
MDPASIAAGAACVAAGAGVVAAFSGVRTLRQARRDSTARSRPMLAAELRIVPYVQGSLKLVVKNYGPSIAKNVWVTFQPLLPDPSPEIASQSVTPFLKRRYSRKIATLTPGMELENIYYSGRPGPDGIFVNFEPLPDQVTVRLVYEDTSGRSYRDVFHLDTQLFHDMTIATSSGAPDAKIKEIAGTLKKIEGHMKTRRGGRGPGSD